MEREIVILEGEVFFDEDGLLIKAEFVTINDLVDCGYIETEKTVCW